MTEKEIYELIDELQGSPNDLREYIANAVDDISEEDLESMVLDLAESSLELREFIVNNLENS